MLQPTDEILEEELDENYQPTQKEIVEYATYLGFKLPTDNDLLYIAKEGLKAPLPKEWKPCKKPNGQIYYFNFESGDSKWEHPCDDYYRKQYQAALAKKTTQIYTEPKKAAEPKKQTNNSKTVNITPQANSKLVNEFEVKREAYLRKKENDLLNIKAHPKNDSKFDLQAYKQSCYKKLQNYKEILGIERQSRLMKIKQEYENQCKETIAKETTQKKEPNNAKIDEILKEIEDKEGKMCNEALQYEKESLTLLTQKETLMKNKETKQNNQGKEIIDQYKSMLSEYTTAAKNKKATQIAIIAETLKAEYNRLNDMNNVHSTEKINHKKKYDSQPIGIRQSQPTLYAYPLEQHTSQIEIQNKIILQNNAKLYEYEVAKAKQNTINEQLHEKQSANQYQTRYDDVQSQMQLITTKTELLKRIAENKAYNETTIIAIVTYKNKIDITKAKQHHIKKSIKDQLNMETQATYLYNDSVTLQNKLNYMELQIEQQRKLLSNRLRYTEDYYTYNNY